MSSQLYKEGKCAKCENQVGQYNLNPTPIQSEEDCAYYCDDCLFEYETNKFNLEDWVNVTYERHR